MSFSLVKSRLETFYGLGKEFFILRQWDVADVDFCSGCFVTRGSVLKASMMWFGAHMGYYQDKKGLWGLERCQQDEPIPEYSRHRLSP